MALPPSGTIKQSEVKAEFGKGNNLLDYLGEGGVTATAPLKLTDFYGKSSTGAVDYWAYNAPDYVKSKTFFSPGDTGGINRTVCPWNETGAAFDKTDATKGTGYDSAMTCTQTGTGGGAIRSTASGSGFDGPINSQYPNDGSTSYCEALYPFQKLKAGSYQMTGTCTAWAGSGRWAEVYLYVICMSQWMSMYPGIGKAHTAWGQNGVSRQQVLGGRNITAQSQVGSFTVPEGYEYVCLEFRNANNVYQSGGGSSITNVVATKTSRMQKLDDSVVVIPPKIETVPEEEVSPPEVPLPPDAVLG